MQLGHAKRGHLCQDLGHEEVLRADSAAEKSQNVVSLFTYLIPRVGIACDVNIHVYIYIYICIYVCVYIYIYICICICRVGCSQ